MLIIFCAVLVFTIGRCTDDQGFVTKTVCLGEDVTLTCNRQPELAGVLFWMRVVPGNFPEILGATYTFNNANVNKTPRIITKQEPGIFVLHIIQTELSDAGLYYCQQVVELKTTLLNKTLLRVKEPEPDITAVTQDSLSDPVRPGDSVTLQCSVLSDSEKKTCPGDHSVFWFKAGSHESHPNIIYAHGDSAECEKSPEAGSSQKCVYSFSKDVSSSDAGTYYCAVATCGEILFGNGTKLYVEASNMSSGSCQTISTVLCLTCAALAISLFVIALLIYTIKTKKCSCFNAAPVPQTSVATTTDDQQSQQTDEDSLVYSVAVFTRVKPGRSVRKDATAVEEESIYTDVRVLGKEQQHVH